MSKYILVTGAAGFIASNLVAELNRRGFENILAVDALGTDEHWKNLRGLRFADYIQRDALPALVSKGLLRDVSCIYHLGACSATTETDADFLISNNTGYTKSLCIAALEAGTRFVYASSAATYGDGAQGYRDDESALDTLRPLNMYGMSKHLFDLWALRRGILPQIAGLKYFNVYGPHEDYKGDMRSVIHKAHGQVLADGCIRLFKSYRPDYADGEQLRDFVHVSDAVDMTLYCGEHPEFSGIFNCGTGRARSWNDLARAVFAAMDRPANIEYIDMPETLRPKYQYFTQADMSKPRSLGYTHQFLSLESGVSSYIRTYLSLQ